jgi:lysophospholipase L1-like esterase
MSAREIVMPSNRAWAIAASLLVASLLGYRALAPEIELHYALQKTEGPNPEHPTIAMLGDSQTLAANWPRLMKCPNIANFGVGGNTSAQMLERLPAIVSAHPRFVFIMAGTNDAIESVDPTSTILNLEAIEADLTDHGIEFVVQTPPPLPAQEARIEVISSVATLKIPFTVDDLLNDRIHLRRSGYAKWRDAISPIVARYC